MLPPNINSGAGSSSPGMAPAIAAKKRKRQLNHHQKLREERSNQKRENECKDQRLRVAQESHDAREYQALSRDRAYAANLEAYRRFIQFRQPSARSSWMSAEEHSNDEGVKDLSARFFATDKGREHPEVMREQSSHDASPVGSSYNRNIE